MGAAWRFVRDRFSRWHLWILGLIWLPATVWTYLIVSAALDVAPDRPELVALTTIASVLGPMTGAISREFSSCCLEFSLSLLPWCGGALVGATAFQFLPLPAAWWARGLRLAAWTAGLIVWFGGGIVSFGHVLS